MTLAQILVKGWQQPRVELGTVRAAYKIETSVARFVALTELAVTRRSKIRAAHRRWLRKTGQPLTPLPVHCKYRAKKAR